MYVKICGLRDPQNIAMVAQLKPSYMGFDFRNTSARYVGEVDETLLYPIDSIIRKIGVFDQHDTMIILSRAGRFSLNAVQIEGDKSSEALEILSGEGLEVIKVVELTSPSCLEKALKWDGVVNKFIFRIPSPQQVCLLEQWRGSTQFLVSAPWGAVELGDVLSVGNDKMCGVDSWFSMESHLGCKDVEQVEKFIKQCRKV